MSLPYTLILLRHGNSTWNQKNRFTGWVDVRLSDQGVTEANRAGELLNESGLAPDVQYTSVLTRAIQTANIALEVADPHEWELSASVVYVRRSGADGAGAQDLFGMDAESEAVPVS